MAAQLKWSDYNLVDEVGDVLLVYNTATGTVLKITDPIYREQIQTLIEHPVNLDSISAELHSCLIEPLLHKRV